ncbi:MAG: hypothetical protein ACLQMF_12035 [Rectinemataceae bacterium]
MRKAAAGGILSPLRGDCKLILLGPSDIIESVIPADLSAKRVWRSRVPASFELVDTMLEERK